MQIVYPVELSRQKPNVVRVAFPDFPGTWAECATGDEQAAANGLLIDALEHCMKERREIPRPTRNPGRQLIEPPVLVAAKVALYQAMHKSHLSNVALAGELGTVEGTVRRLIDLRHRSHVGQVEAALATLGKRLAVTVRRA